MLQLLRCFVPKPSTGTGVSILDHTGGLPSPDPLCYIHIYVYIAPKWKSLAPPLEATVTAAVSGSSLHYCRYYKSLAAQLTRHITWYSVAYRPRKIMDHKMCDIITAHCSSALYSYTVGYRPRFMLCVIIIVHCCWTRSEGLIWGWGCFGC